MFDQGRENTVLQVVSAIASDAVTFEFLKESFPTCVFRMHKIRIMQLDMYGVFSAVPMQSTAFLYHR